MFQLSGFLRVPLRGMCRSELYTSSRGPRCSDIATPNQTPTRGRRVLLLRLAKKGPTRHWKRAYAKGRRHVVVTRQGPRGRQPPTPLATLGQQAETQPGAGNPRPHSPTLREGGGAGRDHFLRLTHSDSSFAPKPRDREAAEDCPSCLALQTSTQSLLQLFGHHTGWLACPNSCQGRNGPDGAKGRGAEAPTTGFEDKRQKLDTEAGRQPGRIPLVTARSSAAGPFSPHMGRNTSAGRRPCCTPWPASQPPASVGRGGRRPGFSSSGLRPAASHRSARRLRSRLCLLTRSPPQVHALAWSPKRSASPSHMVQYLGSRNPKIMGFWNKTGLFEGKPGFPNPG